MDKIFWNLVTFINVNIIVPFICITVVMMLIGSYILDMIALYITSPIVELNEKIRDILVFRY